MAGQDGYRKIKILIASPSDVSTERAIAEKVIKDWNIQNSDERKLMIEPVLWESHSAPESGDRIQGILNKKSKHWENKRRKGHKRQKVRGAPVFLILVPYVFFVL